MENVKLKMTNDELSRALDSTSQELALAQEQLGMLQEQAARLQQEKEMWVLTLTAHTVQYLVYHLCFLTKGTSWLHLK